MQTNISHDKNATSWLSNADVIITTVIGVFLFPPFRRTHVPAFTIMKENSLCSIGIIIIIITTNPSGLSNYACLIDSESTENKHEVIGQ